jgi:phosphoglycolate phosphatase/putative hydrolase of the HAD superfamily
MRVYQLPAERQAIIFDIDGTLYDHPDYVRFQIDVLIAELARIRGESLAATSQAIAVARTALAARSGQATTSLGNAMAELGVDIATSVAWRQRLIDPARFLAPDGRLRAAIQALADGGLLVSALTNNPRSIGLATLRALGVADLFKQVTGLDDTMRSKPDREPFLAALQALPAPSAMRPPGPIPPATVIAVGDRYDVDLAVPLAMGMGAILVDGVRDIYELPALLGLD